MPRLLLKPTRRRPIATIDRAAPNRAEVAKETAITAMTLPANSSPALNRAVPPWARHEALAIVREHGFRLANAKDEGELTEAVATLSLAISFALAKASAKGNPVDQEVDLASFPEQRPECRGQAFACEGTGDEVSRNGPSGRQTRPRHGVAAPALAAKTGKESEGLDMRGVDVSRSGRQGDVVVSKGRAATFVDFDPVKPASD